MAIVKVNDLTMYYEIHGKGEPIVFIGGFSADHTVWASVLDYFKASYQVILFDNRGAGQTDIPRGPYSIDHMTDDVVGLCAQLNIKKAHFVGSSMGGFILQRLAYKHPELVQTAIIVNSAANIHTCFHFYVAAQLDLIKAGASLATLSKISCSWVFSYQFLSQPGMLDGLIQLGLNNPYPFTTTGYEGQYAALDGFDSTAWVSDIHVPTLVLGGDEDLIFSEKVAKALAEKMPQAEFYSFSHCGHLPQIEQPQLFFNVIDEFIRK